MHGEAVHEFRTTIQTHTKVKNVITEETTRIVEISRIHSEFIDWPWGHTWFKKRIDDIKQ